MSNKKLNLTTPIIMLIAGAIAGLMLLIKPGATLNSVIRIAGWALIINGAVTAVQLFMAGKRNVNDYISCILQVAGGIAFMAIARFLVKLIPIVVGLGLIGLGAYKIKTAIDMKGKGKLTNQMILIIALAAVSAIVGIYVLLHPSGFTNTVIRILGAYILIECAEDLFAYYVSK